VPASSERAVPAPLAERAHAIRLLVLDVDGVLTDGTLYFSHGGEQLKAFHIQDGLGIKLLRASGVQVAIVTGRRSQALEQRARELGVERLFQGADDKLAAFPRCSPRRGCSRRKPHAWGTICPTCRCSRAAAWPLPCPRRPRRYAPAPITSRGAGGDAVRCARCASC